MPKAQRPNNRNRSSTEKANRGARDRWYQPVARLSHGRRHTARPSAARRLRLGRSLRLLAAAALLAAGAYGASTLYHSPLVAVEKVEVSNTRYVDPEYVAEVSGLAGKNIFALDVQAARTQLREIPLVRDVDIQRHWPRRIHIVVHERQPWGFWEVLGKRYTIDQEGVVLDRGLPVEGSPLIVETDIGHVLQPGDRVDADALHLAQVLHERLPAGLRLQPAVFEFRRRDGLTVIMKGGLRVTFGDSHDLEYKLSALKALLTRVPGATSVDLRFGDRIVFQEPERPIRP